jgi:hypothetical protein
MKLDDGLLLAFPVISVFLPSLQASEAVDSREGLFGCTSLAPLSTCHKTLAPHVANKEWRSLRIAADKAASHGRKRGNSGDNSQPNLSSDLDEPAPF